MRGGSCESRCARTAKKFAQAGARPRLAPVRRLDLNRFGVGQGRHPKLAQKKTYRQTGSLNEVC